MARFAETSDKVISLKTIIPLRLHVSNWTERRGTKGQSRSSIKKWIVDSIPENNIPIDRLIPVITVWFSISCWSDQVNNWIYQKVTPWDSRNMHVWPYFLRVHLPKFMISRHKWPTSIELGFISTLQVKDIWSSSDKFITHLEHPAVWTEPLAQWASSFEDKTSHSFFRKQQNIHDLGHMIEQWK